MLYKAIPLTVALIVSASISKVIWAQESKATDKSPVQTTQSTGQAAQPESKGCLIVKHKGTVGRRLIFTALIGVPIAPGAKYDLVDSVGYKAEKVAYKGKELQALQKQGVHVIVLEKKAGPEDVEAARKSCQEKSPKPAGG